MYAAAESDHRANEDEFGDAAESQRCNADGPVLVTTERHSEYANDGAATLAAANRERDRGEFEIHHTGTAEASSRATDDPMGNATELCRSHSDSSMLAAKERHSNDSDDFASEPLAATADSDQNDAAANSLVAGTKWDRNDT